MARKKEVLLTPAALPADDGGENRATEKKKTAKQLLTGRGLMPTVQMLAVKDLIPTDDNSRTISEHSPAFVELLASIKAGGVRIPVIVRPHPTLAGKYDLRAGARRHRAAQIAKIAAIPAMVYEGMSDEDAFDATFFENYGRADLTPIEEAQSAALLLEHHHGDLQAVADKFDKSPAWVKRRSYVHAHLIGEWKLAMEHEDSDFHNWTISHLELIARFDEETQKRFLTEMQGWNCPDSVESLAGWLAKSVRLIQKAKWDMDEVLVDENQNSLPACSGCPKRSSCQPLLWEDGANAEVSQQDRCLDEACWKVKQRVFMTNELAFQQKKYPGLKAVMLGVDYSERRELQEQFKGATDIKDCSLVAKKSDPEAVPYFVVGGTSAGSVVWRKLKKGATDSARTGKVGGHCKSRQDRQRELDSKRYNVVLKQMIGEVRNSEVTDIVYKDKTKAILVLVSTFGTSDRGLDREFGVAFSAMGEDTLESLLAAVYERVLPRLIESIAYSGPITQVPQTKIDAARSLAHLLQIDFEDLLMKALAAIPTPKTLAGMQDDDPPKSEAESDDDGANEDEGE